MKRLQKLINQTAKTHAAFYRAQAALNEFCRNKYGYEPGDVDADDIIDSVLGGRGEASGMRAEDFDRVMIEARPK